jgi:hypothetical protein
MVAPFIPLIVELAPVGIQLIEAGIAMIKAHEAQSGAPATAEQSAAVHQHLEEVFAWLKGAQPKPPPLVLPGSVTGT